jgi:sugar lactone lactonase YvrE
MNDKRNGKSELKAILYAVVSLSAFSSGAVRAAAPVIFASDPVNGRVLEFDSSGNPTVFTTGLSPYGLAFDSAGNLYVADETTDAILKYAPNGASLGTFASTGTNNPRGIAFDPLGNLFVAESNDTIHKYSSTGADLGVFASGLNNPVGIAVDQTGSVYVANSDGGSIQKFTSDGSGSLFSGGLTNPFGLAFDSAGFLYVSNVNINEIFKFQSDGTFVSVYADHNSGLTSPAGLTFDSANDLYVANNSSNLKAIEEITPGGSDTIFANARTTFLASEIPEPGATGLLLSALGTWMLRRRRKR